MGERPCIRRLRILIFALAALSLFAGCMPAGQHKIETGTIPPEKQILRVGVTPNSPPLIFKQGNEIVG
ncbi:MAG: hypothetical protein P8X90_06740, partial [Desulfobacterales bacterium]